ncbi:sugar kinase [Roseateles sp. UC29_93]|uniref:sugar kinase n=1 Tax=Roseateles sp. UC29_93 TaxID=3350177 RepID=UPI003670AC04
MTKRVAVIGECMLELKGEAFGAMTLGYGGDTFNTAVYLRRCGATAGLEVAYATALGDDGLSAGLLDRWREQGIDTRLVRRLAGRMPGLYMIEVDGRGERSFHYWRDTAAAKAYFEVERTPLEAHAEDFDALYLSGITLAILPPAGRERLYALMAAMRERGAHVVFDNNYRPRLWADRHAARVEFERAFSLATIALVTADDHQALMDLPDLDAAIAHAKALSTPEVLIKRGASSTLVRAADAQGRPAQVAGPHPSPLPQAGEGEGRGVWLEAPTQWVERVVDTTAAGDSFAGGYLARRLSGHDAVSAAAHGNRVAARVIGHPGAIIPAEAMADLL